MPWLDKSSYEQALLTHYADRRTERLIGRDGTFDSGYLDLTRFFGPGSVTPDEIALHYASDSFVITDARIRRFAEETAQIMREEGRLYDGPLTTKLVAFAPGDEMMTIQPVAYADVAGSCFALDRPTNHFQPHATLRQYFHTVDPLHTVSGNPLAISLGVCGYVLIREEGDTYIVQVRRSRNLAALPASYGPSVAGSVDYESHWRSVGQMLREVMTREANEELRLTEDDYRFVPLGYGRETWRGDRPQLFACLELLISRQELLERVRMIPLSDREFSALRFWRLAANGTLPSRFSTRLNPEASTACYLLEEYLGHSS